MGSFTSKEDKVINILRNGKSSQQYKPLFLLQQLCLPVLWGISPSPILAVFVTWFLMTLLLLQRHWQVGHSLVFHSQKGLSVCVDNPANSPCPQSLWIPSDTKIPHHCMLAMQYNIPLTTLLHLPVFIISLCSILPHGLILTHTNFCLRLSTGTQCYIPLASQVPLSTCCMFASLSFL